MVSLRQMVCAAVAMLAVSTLARAEDGFPFGTEMTLEALPQAGSKRIPNIEIGDHGEVVLELWCKGGKGQFSVAGNTVIFVPGRSRIVPVRRQERRPTTSSWLRSAASRPGSGRATC